MILEKKSSYLNLKNIKLDPEQEEIFGSPQRYVEMCHLYRSAMGELGTKLESLDEEFHICHDRNPIHHMESRLKSPKSIIKKLQKKNLPVNLESAMDNIQDIAGIRLICYYIEDIYSLVALLESRDDIWVTGKADYIKEPKASGYRSIHLDVSVPVCMSGRQRQVPVEIQIRTIAMDFWASLEHQLRYKAPDRVPVSLRAQLKDCAQAIAAIDGKMEDIYNEVKSL